MSFQCSESCDGGTQRRRAICVNTQNDVLDDSKCTHQEKVTIQRCNEFPCPQWKSGDWSEVRWEGCSFFQVISGTLILSLPWSAQDFNLLHLPPSLLWSLYLLHDCGTGCDWFTGNLRHSGFSWITHHISFCLWFWRSSPSPSVLFEP